MTSFRSSSPAHAATGRAWYRRPVIWILAAVVVIIVAVGGPIAYARWLAPKAPAPLAMPALSAAGPAGAGENTGAATTGASPLASSHASPDGEWAVSPGSLAGYRVNEVLNGQRVTVAGRTSQVTGSVTVASGALVAAEVQVDMASVRTGNASRDSQFRSSILRTGQFPTATFTATAPVALDPAHPRVRLPGTLTIAGKTATLEADVAFSGDPAGTIRAAGSIPITFATWGIAAPDLGFVKVEDHGLVEFSLALRRR